jgi:hypothetical protein
MGIGTYISGGLNTLTLGVIGSQDPRVRTFVVKSDGTVAEDSALREARDWSQRRSQGTLGAVGLGMAAVAGGQAVQGRLAQVGFRLAEQGASTFGLSAARWGVGSMQGLIGALGVLGVGGSMLAMNGNSSAVTNWLTDRVTPDTVIHKFYDENEILLGERTLTRAEEAALFDSDDGSQLLDFTPTDGG